MRSLSSFSPNASVPVATSAVIDTTSVDANPVSAITSASTARSLNATSPVADVPANGTTSLNTVTSVGAALPIIAANSVNADRTSRRHRGRHRSAVRFQLPSPMTGTTQPIHVASTASGSTNIPPPRPPSSRRSFLRPTLMQRRRLSLREAAIADARLATKFPARIVQILSGFHLFSCFLVLFIQFWTSSRVHAAYHWVRSVNTYGYMCALLSGLAGCTGIALYLQQSKVRAMAFLSMCVSSAFTCCYLLTFYTTYFAEIRMFVSAQGCIEKYNKHPSFKVPFACMTILTLLEFFCSFASVVVISTIINRARACWWSCDPCAMCHMEGDVENPLDEEERGMEEDEETNIDDVISVTPNSRFRFTPRFELPPSYYDHPPPYKP